VVEEAASDVIAAAQAGGTSEPWTPLFHRFDRSPASCQPDEVQFYDRSPVCTAAL
jgi:predicted ATPase